MFGWSVVIRQGKIQLHFMFVESIFEDCSSAVTTMQVPNHGKEIRFGSKIGIILKIIEMFHHNPLSTYKARRSDQKNDDMKRNK